MCWLGMGSSRGLSGGLISVGTMLGCRAKGKERVEGL